VPVLTLVADATYPHLYRIRYPSGWTSTPANLSRAKDAAPSRELKSPCQARAFGREFERALTKETDA
jgi:hypothetical protein